MKKLAKMLMVIAVLGIAVVSCEKNDFLTEEAENEEVALKSASGVTMMEYIDLDYLDPFDYYVISGKDEYGARKIFYGQQGNWNLLPDKYGTNAIWGELYDASFSRVDGKFEFAFDFNGKVAVQAGSQFYGKPRFNSGKYILGPGGDKLLDFIDLDYFPGEDYWVISGMSESGDVDTYYGKGKSWTKLADKYDGAQPKGTLVGTAFDNSGDGLSVAEYNSIVQVNGMYTHYNKPRFNSGGSSVGDSGDKLTELIDIDYLPSEDAYVITGMSESGDLDTYMGTIGNWTKVQDDRDAGVAWGSPYFGTAFDDDPDNDGKFDFLYSYLHPSKGLVTNGGYEFYDLPRFNTGANKVE